MGSVNVDLFSEEELNYEVRFRGVGLNCVPR